MTSKRRIQIGVGLLAIIVLVLGIMKVTSTGLFKEATLLSSKDYVLAMGQGWNLGNTFDGLDTNWEVEDVGETAWGNPVVTRELIRTIKEKGFDSIRLPLTLYRRYTVEDGKATIDTAWLERYQEVVEWSLEEDLYVMINIHHDSWIWLSDWKGDESDEIYTTFVQLWDQLADFFKKQPYEVSFETINEPNFRVSELKSPQEKLASVNQAAYEAIRNSGGRNKNRMIIIPTLHTNHEMANSAPVANWILEKEDPNLIATVHYYSDWVFSANLGKTEFDEILWGEDHTPRKGADELFEIIDEAFIQNDIGVVIGEYGLLGYDAGHEVTQLGEELKYYEYVNYKAMAYGVCLMFWDNGSGINRYAEGYPWRKPQVGLMLEANNAKERSSYGTGLDTLYLEAPVSAAVQVPLTLNGNRFVGIQGLNNNQDYTYDEQAAVVILEADFVNNHFETMADRYGLITTLTLEFDAGAPWEQHLVKYGTPEVLSMTEGPDSLTISMDFKGARVRQASAYQDEILVGPHSAWWSYLQYGGAFYADYEKGQIQITDQFFSDRSVGDGAIEFVFTFFDGQVLEVTYLTN